MTCPDCQNEMTKLPREIAGQPAYLCERLMLFVDAPGERRCGRTGVAAPVVSP